MLCDIKIKWKKQEQSQYQVISNDQRWDKFEYATPSTPIKDNKVSKHLKYIDERVHNTVFK